MTDHDALVAEARALSLRLEHAAIDIATDQVPPEVTLPLDSEEPRTKDEYILITTHAMTKAAEMIDRLAAALTTPGGDGEPIFGPGTGLARCPKCLQTMMRKFLGAHNCPVASPSPASREDVARRRGSVVTDEELAYQQIAEVADGVFTDALGSLQQTGAPPGAIVAGACMALCRFVIQHLMGPVVPSPRGVFNQLLPTINRSAETLLDKPKARG